MEFCNSCSNAMSGKEVVCRGFCKANFHYKCAHLSESFYKDICGNSAIFWLCKGFCDLMKNARFKNAMSSTNTVMSELKDAYQTVVEELKAEIKNSLIAELKEEIQGGFNRLSPALLPPMPRQFQFRSRNTPKRSRDEDAPDPVGQPTKIFRGTGQQANSALGGPVVSSVDKFWVYLTKISPEVSESDVQNLARECLQTNDIIVKPLAPKGKPLSMLSFVSFKVLRAKEMNPSTWPQGIEFREFIDSEPITRNFWKPKPRLDPGATSTSQ
ncbi:uncharacterized protein LOC129719963 [Wyeomyia smithii]|uniref:uncharacterized protein LOC129719963 n=1 Tax=Wyeomyia smithii TaxID=174621 RepID=UPI0024680624|nr:uncharacterized protein LOC129719963 [Wyeomyia smithii]